MSFAKKLLIALAFILGAQISLLAGFCFYFAKNESLCRWFIRDFLERLGAGESYESPEEVVKETSAALKVNKDDTYALRSRAAAYADLLDYQNSLADYDHLIRLEPNRSEWYQARSQVYFQSDDFEKALKDVERAIALSGLDSERLLLRGKSLLSLKRKTEAKKDFDKILQEYKGDQVELNTYLDLCDRYLDMLDGDSAARTLELAAAKKDTDEYEFHEKQRSLADFYLKRLDYDRAAKIYQELVALPHEYLNYSDFLKYVNLLAIKGDTAGSTRVKARAIEQMTKSLESDRYGTDFVDMCEAAALLKNLKLDGRQSEYESIVTLVMPKAKKMFKDYDSAVDYRYALLYLLPELPKPKAKELASSFMELVIAKESEQDIADEMKDSLAEYLADDATKVAQEGAEKASAADELESEPVESETEEAAGPGGSAAASGDKAEVGSKEGQSKLDAHSLHQQADEALERGEKTKALKLARQSFAMAPDESCSADTLATVAWSCHDNASARTALEALFRHSQIDGDQALLFYELATEEKKAAEAEKYLSLAMILGNDEALALYRKKHNSLGVALR